MSSYLFILASLTTEKYSQYNKDNVHISSNLINQNQILDEIYLLRTLHAFNQQNMNTGQVLVSLL